MNQAQYKILRSVTNHYLFVQQLQRRESETLVVTKKNDQNHWRKSILSRKYEKLTFYCVKTVRRESDTSDNFPNIFQN